MKPKQVIFRQGDVLLTLVAALPSGAKDVTPDNRIVLAHGEVTGHAHAVYEPLTKDAPKGKARMWDAGAERFLQVVEHTALKHEEHAAIPLPPGVYKVTQQREYSPSEIRNVAD
jgi:hypothetical protein